MPKVLITILVFQVNLKDMLAHISKDILALYLSPDIFVKFSDKFVITTPLGNICKIMDSVQTAAK